MNKTIYLKQKVFKRFKNTKYFVSFDGEVFSVASQKILKPLMRPNGYLYIDIIFAPGQGQKHVPIHRMVAETWLGPCPEGLQVNHINDDKKNNSANNLYYGTQRENVNDRVRNNHNIGPSRILTVYDKEKQEVVTFFPAKEIIPYAGHSQVNGGVSRCMTRNWFKKRFDIIEYRLVKNTKDVTTIADECKRVGQKFIADRSARLCKGIEEIV